MRSDKPPPADEGCCYTLRIGAWVALGFVLLLGFARCANAIQLTNDQCQEMAVWASDTVWAKHVGAEKEKVRAYYAEQRSPIFRLILKDLDKIWELDIRFRLPLYEAILQVCNNNRGIYPDET